MFDEPPQNLPVEPGKAPPPKNAPRPVMQDKASDVPITPPTEVQEPPAVPPAPAEPGTSRPGNEPEDMFAGMDEVPSEESTSSASGETPVKAVENKGSAGKIIGIVIAILIFVGVIGGGVWYFFIRQEPVTAPVVVAPVQTIIEEPPVLPPEIIPPSISPPAEPEPVPEEPADTLVPEALAVVSQDTDSDGLTDAEEDVFGTSRVLADSDGDTFDDGSEVESGYDPSVSGARLIDSRSFAFVDIGTMWRLFLPTSWVLQEDPVILGDFIVETATENTLHVHFDQKPRILTFEDWFGSNVSGVDFASLVQGTTESGDSYWMTSDGRTTYVTDDSSIISVRLMTNGSGRIDFPTVFKMMSKNIEQI
ncbi:MAG: hypothetical protein NUV81_02960 [bacterium]|nr:hypothetical protein [bacterium]